jgi:PHD/YefM family antitoxin component YafN of YafNO toxin-antitoxin module
LAEALTRSEISHEPQIRALWKTIDNDCAIPLSSERILNYLREMRRITVTLPSSDLSRNPAKVFGVAETTPVRISRRDGKDLVLIAESELAARDELLQLAAELIAVSTDDEGTLVTRMANRFSWMLALGEKDQAACTADLIRAARASFSTGGAHIVLASLESWKGTAEAIALGLDKQQSDPLDRPEPVKRPA